MLNQELELMKKMDDRYKIYTKV